MRILKCAIINCQISVEVDDDYLSVSGMKEAIRSATDKIKFETPEGVSISLEDAVSIQLEEPK